ncbi:MAG: ATPase [Verrucomicrobiota bacterium]
MIALANTDNTKKVVSFTPHLKSAATTSLLVDDGHSFKPPMPMTIEELGISSGFLGELVLKAMAVDPNSTASDVATRLHLGLMITDAVLQKLTRDKFVEIKGVVGSHNHRYAMLERGWTEYARVSASNSYVGPAPVSLDAYSDRLSKQVQARPPSARSDLDNAMGELVLNDGVKQVLGLVASSGRSLFLSGPSGNGKTAIARALVDAIDGNIWIPYAIEVDGQVIRLFDPHTHEACKIEETDYDRRWVKIKPPLVVVGGELTIESMDLANSPAHRYYEAPFQLKSNGGVLVVDDLGRQRCSPEALLNRWIIPLESRIDYLTLNNGKKFQVPFEQVIVFATNLTVSDLADEAFLRRMGYRIHVMAPSPQTYADIFIRYARRHGLTVDPTILAHLEIRYGKENREPKACEPRDLIDRAMEVCRYNREKLRLSKEIVDIAWDGYFGAVAAG